MNPGKSLRLSRLAAFALSLGLLFPAAAADRLQDAASSFLRAHADNAVEWMPWGEAAFARAKEENRPIYLVIGTTGSELSAAMNRQTFTNPEVAGFLNEHFVCVLVDREEHPALAAQGQAYVRAVKQLSGWPLNLWLTPDLLPFEGASYLPPSEEWGKEGFLIVARRAAEMWENDAAFTREDAQQAVATVREYETPLPAERFDVSDVRTSLQGSAAAWIAQSDAEHGGFGESPRHPEPEMLRFLLRADATTRRAAAANLRATMASGLRDPIDGGFFRYTTDANARIPYFQKRLSDQARMVFALLDAHQLESDPHFPIAARGALDYVLRRLQLPNGGYAAGEDATGDRAAYYPWTHQDLLRAAGREGEAFATAHGAKRDGNVSRDDDPANTLLGLNLLAGAPDPRWNEAIERLRAVRDERPAPVRDDNLVAGEQGLILHAFARAGRELDEPRYTEAAQQLAAFIERTFLQENNRLRRLAGSDAPAGPADYAAVALGLRALDQPKATSLATRLLQAGDDLFFDREAGIIFTTPEDLPPGLWLRLAAPAGMPGETPAAAPLRLIAGEPFHDKLPALLATQHRDPAGSASGDILLALRIHVDRLP